jgi:SAM-dependent methyltransferase
MGQAIFSHNGHCPICETAVAFVSENTWFRDHLLCTHCLSVPRERAVMHVIAQLRPDWRTLRIHESSPSDRAASRKLRQQAAGYIGTQYFPDVAGGEIDPATGMRCENLSAQTFADESFDLVVTQDVFEHIPEPANALREIARTLRPGGFHVASVPLVRKWQPTQIRARLKDGAIEHILPPEYHGNPISDAGSLVTTDWGYDFAAFCQRESGMDTIIQQIDNIDLGIRAEFIEIVVSHKSARTA